MMRQILVFEDESNDADHIQATLEHSGFCPAMVSTGQEAVEKIEATKPDLMLVDPASDTSANEFAALGELHSRLDIPLVFILPYGDDVALERAVERVKSTEPDGFVLKPYHEHELVETVESVLRKHAAAPKRAMARAQLLNLAQTTPDLVAVADVEGNLLHLNPAARKRLGLGQEQDLAGLDLASIHPTWANMIVLGEGIETAILDGVWRGEAALLGPDGNEIPVSEVILAHMGADGRCETLTIVARDISELASAGERVRRSEQFYRHMVETSNVGIWVIDPENRISFANPRICAMLGYTFEEMAATPLSTLIGMEEASLTGEAEAAQPGLRDRRPLTLRGKDGRQIPVILSTSPMYDEQERYTGVLAVVTPVVDP